MGFVESKTFKSGNSVAVRLPKSLGIAANVEMRIEKRDGGLILTPIFDAEQEKAALADLVRRLRALPRPDEIEKREPIEFPDRPGL